MVVGRSGLGEDLAQLGGEGLRLARLAVLTAQESTVVAREDDGLLAEALGGVIDVAPTTRREFTNVQQVSALVRAYVRRGDPPAGVEITFRVLDHQLREVLAQPMTVTAGRFAADGSAEARFNLPLDRLQPGAFVLRVDAKRNSSSAWRDVRFSVR